MMDSRPRPSILATKPNDNRTLCAQCSSIFIEQPREIMTLSNKSDRVLHARLIGLYKESSRGCWICKCVLDAFQQRYCDDPAKFDFASWEISYAVFELHGRRFIRFFASNNYLRYGEAESFTSLEMIFADNVPYDTEAYRFANWHKDPKLFEDIEKALTQNDLYSFSAGCPPMTDLDSIVRLCKIWLNICNEGHSECQSARSSLRWNPTRLLHIQDDLNSIRLVNSGDIPGAVDYVTLSHCWGSVPTFSLKSDNITSLMASIPTSGLPKTFREALLFACHLGFRFLWIDSLCIIQDSDSDWHHEAHQMSQVYRNAILNIAATGASSGSEGLFHVRDFSKVPPLPIFTTWEGRWTMGSGPNMGNKYFLIEYDFVEKDISDAPLNRRAWVLQERMLSPRTIHFSKRQVYWECWGNVFCESFPAGIIGDMSHSRLTVPGPRRLPLHGMSDRDYIKPNSVPNYYAPDKHTDGPLFLFLDETDPATGSQELREVWLNMVEYYTRCKLTVMSDKLVAISGLATTMTALFKDDYLAGLWRASLPLTLMWKRAPLVDTTPDYFRVGYMAPSWSWASMNCGVDYSLSVRLQSLYSPDYYSAIKGAGVNTLDDRKSGRALAGFIRLTGPLLVGTTSDVFSWTVWRIGGGESFLTVTFDFPAGGSASLSRFIGGCASSSLLSLLTSREALVSTSFFFMPIQGGFEIATETDILCGLVLLPSGRNKGEFVRIGVFETQDSESIEVFSKRVLDVTAECFENSEGNGKYTISIV